MTPPRRGGRNTNNLNCVEGEQVAINESEGQVKVREHVDEGQETGELKGTFPKNFSKVL